jgi:hypothetical protein
VEQYTPERSEKEDAVAAACHLVVRTSPRTGRTEKEQRTGARLSRARLEFLHSLIPKGNLEFLLSHSLSLVVAVSDARRRPARRSIASHQLLHKPVWIIGNDGSMLVARCEALCDVELEQETGVRGVRVLADEQDAAEWKSAAEQIVDRGEAR